MIPAGEHVHDWAEPTYTWSEDNSKVTAERVCNINAEHKETETVDATSEVTTQPTETEAGVRTYTATFANPAFVTQTKTVAIPKLKYNVTGDHTFTAQWKRGRPDTGDDRYLLSWIALMTGSLLLLAEMAVLRRLRSKRRIS